MAGNVTWERGPDWTPRVTAILPCFRADAFISETLASLEHQTWPNLEILIGDDASPDGTLAIVEAFAAGRSDTRVIAREQNLGWLANTNDLMAQASGELMFFAFHDDLVAPSYVERLVDALRRNPRAILAFSDLELFDTDGKRTVYVFKDLTGVRSPTLRALRVGLVPDGWWVPNRGLFRAEAFGWIGGIKRHDAGEFSADLPWLLHMTTLGEFERVPEILCHKFFKPSSLSLSWERNRAQKIALGREIKRTIRESGLGSFSKALFMACFRLRYESPGLQRWLYRPLRGVVRRLRGSGGAP